MEGVGTHQIFCLLADLAGFVRGQKLRADGGVHNVAKNISGLAEAFLLGNVQNQMTDEGLGNGSVHAIHTHMVAVVGAPAESQFAQVTGTHHDAANHAGVIHKHLGAFPGLGIFISAVALGHIVTDIFKVTGNRILNGNFLGGDTQLFHQFPGILIGAVRSAEAGHSHTVHIGGGATQLLHSLHRNQQRQGGVQSAGNTQHRICTDGGKALLQTCNLNLEDIFAPIRQNLGIIRHKGHLFIGVKGAVTVQGRTAAVNATGRLNLGINGNSIPNAGVVAATGTDSTQVHILHQKIIAGDQILVFCDQFAVLGDQAVTGHHQILGGLCRAGGAEGINAAANRRLMGHQILPVSPLAYDFVGSGKIDDHFCAI